jgi:hypothetical protein
MTTRRFDITVRKFTSHAEADKADAAYWLQLSPAERVLQVWRLSLEQHQLRGDPPYEPGLHRSIARVHRR